MRACAFFPPSLDPVLNGRKGHKDTVIAPQVPTRWAVGQAVLDHESHRQLDAIVDRLHGARAEALAGHELGRHDRGRELLEEGLSVWSEPE